MTLQSDDVQVASLVPPSLARLPLAELDAALGELDEPLAARFGEAHRNGARLRFLGRFEDGQASVGLQELPLDHPLCGGGGTDNRVAIYSDRYDVQPLVVQGPGAGAEVTAAALLDDVLQVVVG
jgi:homoserine dehydrogenase